MNPSRSECRGAWRVSTSRMITSVTPPWERAPRRDCRRSRDSPRRLQCGLEGALHGVAQLVELADRLRFEAHDDHRLGVRCTQRPQPRSVSMRTPSMSMTLKRRSDLGFYRSTTLNFTSSGQSTRSPGVFTWGQFREERREGAPFMPGRRSRAGESPRKSHRRSRSSGLEEMWPLISPASSAFSSFIFDLMREWPVFHDGLAATLFDVLEHDDWSTSLRR